MLVEHRALENYWHVVAEIADIGAEHRSACACSDATSCCGVDPSGEVVAAPDRCPHREAPLSLGSRARRLPVVPVPRLDVRRRRSLRAGAVVGRGPAGSARRAPARRMHVAERYGLVWVCPGEPVIPHPDDRCRRRPGLPADQHRRRHVARVGGADDRQLPRHLPLPVRARRHVRHRVEHAGAEDRTRPARRRLLRLRLHGRGRQRSRSGGVRDRCRRGHAADDDRVQPAVHGAQHDPLRDRSRPPDPAVLDARSTTSRRCSRSSSGATTTTPCRPRR